MRILRLLFGLREEVDRKTYVIAGLTLAVIKYGIDFAAVYFTTGKIWTLWAYLSPVLIFREEAIRPAPEPLLWAMAAYALPFAWVGLSMSVRRAANAGLSPWVGVGFLLPGLNWLVILVLSFVPTRARWVSKEHELVPLNLRNAVTSIGLGVALTMSMVATSVYVLGDYGWSLFVGTPFVVGMVAGFLTNRDGKRSLVATAGSAIVAIGLSALAILLFALEGIICIAMAAIPAAIVSIAGSFIGRAIALMNVRGKNAAGVGLVILSLPFIAGAESLDTSNPLYEVETAVVIDASPHEVWDAVINFSELEPPPAWVQRTGIAYPIRARLDGEGVGAVRHCEFSTGAFVEPITAWEPGVRLAFDVRSQPDPMREWSPYHAVHPPHIDGYLRSKRGEFRFVELPNGTTRLEGSTWYEIDISPRSYWSIISDSLIHRIHLRVLEHVKRQAEAG